MQAKGIDVSTWQGIIDWPRAKASGVDFAMLRASYGWMNKDKQTDANSESGRISFAENEPAEAVSAVLAIWGAPPTITDEIMESAPSWETHC